MTSWVWLDGAPSPVPDAHVSAADRGLLFGDGIFETCKVVDGTPFALTRHLARLRASAERVGIAVPWSDSDLRATCAKVVGAALVGSADADIGRLRITVTAGSAAHGVPRGELPPTLVVTTGPTTRWAPTARVVTADWALNERSPVAGAKTTSRLEYVLELDDARRRGADEAVLANTVGALAEGTATNVFLVLDGALVTPSLATGCLPGITRALVLELVDVEERDDLTLDHLRSADEAFLTSSTRDVHPVAEVDGRALGAAPGPRTAAAGEAFAALQARTLDP